MHERDIIYLVRYKAYNSIDERYNDYNKAVMKIRTMLIDGCDYKKIEFLKHNMRTKVTESYEDVVIKMNFKYEYTLFWNGHLPITMQTYNDILIKYIEARKAGADPRELKILETSPEFNPPNDITDKAFAYYVNFESGTSEAKYALKYEKIGIIGTFKDLSSTIIKYHIKQADNNINFKKIKVLKINDSGDPDKDEDITEQAFRLLSNTECKGCFRCHHKDITGECKKGYDTEYLYNANVWCEDFYIDTTIKYYPPEEIQQLPF